MKIGALNFFPAFTPPKSGGELRYYHLYSRLGRWHDVEMVNPTYPDHPRERIEHHPRVIEHRIPKTGRYITWHRALDRLGGFRECSAFVVGMSSPSHKELREEARRLWRECDVLIHEFPYCHSLAPRPRAGQLLVYDAHNVEQRLARDMFPGWVGRWVIHRIAKMEGDCARAADLILACSEDDAAELAALYRLDPLKIRVVPNGVDPGEIRPAEEGMRGALRGRLRLDARRPAILFFGSFHPPNIEAAEYLVEKLAPAVTEADFILAGRVCNALKDRTIPANVRLFGAVDDETKQALLQGCDAAINPMFTGSGTNLKMLEYLAAGLPVVTTPRGARGLQLEHRRHALVVEDQRLVQGVEDLLNDEGLRRSLAREGREHVIHSFSWDAIAESVHELLTIKTRRRVLLLNDFPASPVQSGGQVRLQAVGKQLAEAGHGVTILTLSTAEAPTCRSLGRGVEELTVPRSRLHRWMDLWLYHRIGVGADDISAHLFGWLTPRFARILRREARLARVAVFSHCYLIRYRRLLPRGIPIIHEAYNVESDLKQQMYTRGRLARWLLNAVRRAEEEALRRAAFTSCVSIEDEREFRRRYPKDGKRYVLAPNGVDCRRFSVLTLGERRRLRRAVGLGGEPVVLFLASGHPPNAEAARFILDHLAPALPDVVFLLVGQVCGWFVAHPCPPNTLLLGIVPDPVKNFLLQVADAAVNPMFHGSGTNIKLLDYLAAGLPVVTTPLGARGFRHLLEEVLVVCEPEEFARGLSELLEKPRELEQRAVRSHELALEHFDWSVALGDFLREVKSLLPDDGKDDPDPAKNPSAL
jgi:glycosyltransferase involved in cell wall biosynthesis